MKKTAKERAAEKWIAHAIRQRLAGLVGQRLDQATLEDVKRQVLDELEKLEAETDLLPR